MNDLCTRFYTPSSNCKWVSYSHLGPVQDYHNLQSCVTPPKGWLNFIFCDKYLLYTSSYITHICAVITGLCIRKASKSIFALGIVMSYNWPCYHQTESKRKFSSGHHQAVWCYFFFKKEERKKLHIFPTSYPTPFQKPLVRSCTHTIMFPPHCYYWSWGKFTIMLLSGIKWHNADTKIY